MLCVPHRGYINASPGLQRAGLANKPYKQKTNKLRHTNYPIKNIIEPMRFYTRNSDLPKIGLRANFDCVFSGDVLPGDIKGDMGTPN